MTLNKKEKLSKQSKEVLQFLKKFKRPASIKEISEKLGLNYYTAKSRLLRLMKLNKIRRAKEGVYYTGKKINPFKKFKGKLVKVNGLLYSCQGSGRLVVYNAALAKVSKNKNVIVERKNNIFILRRVPKYFGVGVHILVLVYILTILLF